MWSTKRYLKTKTTSTTAAACNFKAYLASKTCFLVALTASPNNCTPMYCLANRSASSWNRSKNTELPLCQSTQQLLNNSSEQQTALASTIIHRNKWLIKTHSSRITSSIRAIQLQLSNRCKINKISRQWIQLKTIHKWMWLCNHLAWNSSSNCKCCTNKL